MTIPRPPATAPAHAADADATTIEPVVTVADVSVEYPGGVRALDDVSLVLRPGEIVGVAGANGAGKSTLARLLNGLVQPTGGTVRVAGHDTRATGTETLAGIVGLVFQHPRAQLFARSVRDELAFGPRNLGLEPPVIADRVGWVADLLGLRDVLDMSPFELPSPRRRHVTIASVLAMRPQVLVLDEPTTAQDEPTTAGILALVRQLRADGGTVVLVSHDMRLLAESADRVAVLARGRLLADAAPRDVFGDARLLDAAGLRAPQITRLGASLPGLEGRDAFLTVDELIHVLGVA